MVIPSEISRYKDMKLNIAIAFGCLLAFVCTGSAQTRTVTNADLEKFREKRLDAEKDLRENYAKLGFPSPEELEKQNAQAEKERFALFEKLQAERLEREKLEIERQRVAAEFAKAERRLIVIEGQDDEGYYFGYSSIAVGRQRIPWRSRFPFRGNFRGNNGYRVGGGSVIYDSGYSSSTRIGGAPVRQRPSTVWRPVRPR